MLSITIVSVFCGSIFNVSFKYLSPLYRALMSKTPKSGCPEPNISRSFAERLTINEGCYEGDVQGAMVSQKGDDNKG